MDPTMIASLVEAYSANGSKNPLKNAPVLNIAFLTAIYK
jgi:hypothetical protein